MTKISVLMFFPINFIDNGKEDSNDDIDKLCEKLQWEN